VALCVSTEKQSGGSPPFKKKSKTGISAAAAAASSSPFGTTKKDKASKKPKRIRSESEGAAGVAGPGASTLKLKKSSGSSYVSRGGGEVLSRSHLEDYYLGCSFLSLVPLPDDPVVVSVAGCVQGPPPPMAK
jgi:hypothetical protein